MLKYFLALVVLMAIYFLVEGGMFLYRLQHRADLPSIDQSDKTFGAGPEIRYVVAGDSTSVGIGATDITHTYSYLVAQDLAKDHTVLYKNVGVGGYKTQDILDKQVKSIIEYHPDIVTISMGANDATHLVSNGKILQNFKTILIQLQRNTKATIYITDIPNFHGANILPSFYIYLLEARSKWLNKQIIALENERVKVVDIHNFGWYKFPNMESTYSADHFHPNNAGYQNWADAFLNRVHQK